MLIHQVEDIWQCQFPRWSPQCFVTLTKRNDKLVVEDIGIHLNRYWWERLLLKEHRISAKKIGCAWFIRAAPRKGSNIAKMKMGIYVNSELFRDTPVVFQHIQNWWNTRLFHTNGRNISTPKEVRGFFSARKEGQGSAGSLSNTTESLWKGPGGVEASFWLYSSSESTLWNSLETQPRCCILGTIVESAGSRTAMLANRLIYNHGLRHNTRRLHWPRDCSERRLRVIFERLATPRPAPKVTLKRNWRSQQQQQEQQPQQPISNTDVKRLWKQRATRESQKCKTTRNTSQKRIKHLETRCNPFLKWMWILISVTKKSAQMHSRTTKWIIKLLNESKLVQKLVFAKIWRRRRGCLAKNPAKLFSKCVMWSSLN